MAKSKGTGKWTGKDTQRETNVSRREQEKAWHVARDDSGREDTGYMGRLDDSDYRESANEGLNDTLAGDIQSLPSGYESSEDR